MTERRLADEPTHELETELEAERAYWAALVRVGADAESIAACSARQRVLHDELARRAAS